MKNFGSIITLLWTVVWLVTCVPRREKSENTKKITNKVEAIAFEHLILKYEREHQQLYNDQTRDDPILKWPDLDNKDLSNYCKKYLQHSLPKKQTDVVTGTKIVRDLYYLKENTNIIRKVITVRCKILTYRPLYLYITRAPEPNCVYDLHWKLTMEMKNRLTINHKHCDFEDKPFKMALKRKRVEIISKNHSYTGQPIANDEYILKYEMEHQELYRGEAERGGHINWPHATTNHNLDSYCSQYISECVPSRNRKGVTGRWEFSKLHYQKLHEVTDVYVITVTCILVNNRQYHITRALESNCVYALLRQATSTHHVLAIIFKHCDFEDTNNQ